MAKKKTTKKKTRNKVRLSPTERKELGLSLYLSGIPVPAIANQLEVSTNSVYKWSKANRWKYLKSQSETTINKKVLKNVENVLLPGKEAYLKVIAGLMLKVIKEINNSISEKGATVSDLEKLDKIARLERGLHTEIMRHEHLGPTEIRDRKAEIERRITEIDGIIREADGRK